ncbi:MAG TPA: addiction module protein [Pirellulales bacterium]
MHVPDQLVSQVMALSPDARAELLALLQESLPVTEVPGVTGSDDQLAAEWTEELDRRIADSRGGKSPGVDAETAFAQIRKQLASGQGPSGA